MVAYLNPILKSSKYHNIASSPSKPEHFRSFWGYGMVPYLNPYLNFTKCLFTEDSGDVWRLRYGVFDFKEF